MTPDPRVAVWREKIAAGTITPEEYREAVEYLRAGRKAAAELAAVKKKAAAGKGKRKKSTEKESGDGDGPVQAGPATVGE